MEGVVLPVYRCAMCMAALFSCVRACLFFCYFGSEMHCHNDKLKMYFPIKIRKRSRDFVPVTNIFVSFGGCIAAYYFVWF